jgi:ornithine cyclodeaminase/alanine dehydrogenase-like protein (mu-crystallin family)
VDIIDAAGVRTHLSMAECIDAMAQAMISVSGRAASMPPRTVMPLIDQSGYFAVMPGSLGEPLVYGAKVVGLHPANPAAGRPAIQGFVALFDHETGRPLALVDGAEITALRTAAASGLATRLLSRSDSSTLGLLGYGVQAGVHLEAICAVRDIAEVRVWGRSLERARAFAERHSARLHPNIVAVAEPQTAAACDIVCVVTGSPEPIILGEWLQPGAHVNLVGAHSPQTREADTALVKRGRVYVDALVSAFSEAGDILIPIEEGAIAPSHVVGEIGALLLGRVEGRATPAQITVYKSLGVVAQDLVAAHAVWVAYAGSQTSAQQVNVGN